MKNVFLSITLSFALIASAFAQSTVPSYFTQTVVGGRAIASSFGVWGNTSNTPLVSLNATASGAATINPSSCYVTYGANNVQAFPFATNVPVIIVDGSNTETVTPSAVTSPTPNTAGGPNPFSCSFTATFSNAHNAGAKIESADDGAMEAANSLKASGGLVVLDPSVPSSVVITGFTGGFANVSFEDLRSGAPIYYNWNGTAYSPSNSEAAASLQGSCTGTATSSATLGLLGLGTQAIGTCTSTVTSVGPVMSHAGVIKTLTVAAGTGGFNSSSGVFTVLKNGSATTLTCTTGVATSCTDITHSATFVAGDIISLSFTTQATETLANVKASVLAF